MSAYTLLETKHFQKWFGSLADRRTRTRIRARLYRVEQDGHFGDVASVGDGVWEMRLFFGAGYRIYYTLQGSRIVVLLAGGDKSTQGRDIEQAKALARAQDE